MHSSEWKESTTLKLCSVCLCQDPQWADCGAADLQRANSDLTPTGLIQLHTPPVISVLTTASPIAGWLHPETLKL